MITSVKDDKTCGLASADPSSTCGSESLGDFTQLHACMALYAKPLCLDIKPKAVNSTWKFSIEISGFQTHQGFQKIQIAHSSDTTSATYG
jgi:hypothetical protein